jgi:hypothetical protein
MRFSITDLRRLPTRPISRRKFLRGTSALAGIAAGTHLASLLPFSTPAMAGAATLSLAGVQLDDPPAAVLRSKGEPLRKTIVHGQGAPAWVYPGALVLFQRETYGLAVRSIVAETATAGATPEGARVGQGLASVRSTYGPIARDSGLLGLAVLAGPNARWDFETVDRRTVERLVLTRTTCTTCEKPASPPTASPPKPRN